MFLGFEHRDKHNGVGWAQFSKSLKKHIEGTDFHPTNFGHYEGRVSFGELKSANRSIKLGMFTRASYANPQDLQTLKHATINEVGGKSISCVDLQGHPKHAYISVWNMSVAENNIKTTSIAEILNSYDFIEEIVANYEGGTYPVYDKTAEGLPSWIYIDLRGHSCGEKTHVVKQISCDIKRG